ncbi:MAG TPA: potassium channel family protein [Tepidisphaeraceae bacterium]|nr:potassium channel family protein [Tepidisphaeraceae bacterium]
MRIIVSIAALLLIGVTFLDAFETILLPRRVNRRFRYSRFYYRGAWFFWRRLSDRLIHGRWRETTLSIFGPFSMLGLFVSWVLSLVLGFAILHWSVASSVATNEHVPPTHGFASCLYLSGTTFFTLGLGDIIPLGPWSRTLMVVESGLGFGFLAIIISYLPVLYQAFSKRELTISLMDARAGSPPCGGEFLVRLARGGRISGADEILREWEQWCAELLESHLSFPVLAYYRSQHANQSWLAALATMLDTCALLLTSFPAGDPYQEQLTFAMARHAAVDIALIFAVRPAKPPEDRLSLEARNRLHALFRRAGLQPNDSPEAAARIAELRAVYEPFLVALAAHFALVLPPMFPPEPSADNWQRSAWMPRTPGIGSLPAGKSEGSHFD